MSIPQDNIHSVFGTRPDTWHTLSAFWTAVIISRIGFKEFTITNGWKGQDIVRSLLRNLSGESLCFWKQDKMHRRRHTTIPNRVLQNTENLSQPSRALFAKQLPPRFFSSSLPFLRLYICPRFHIHIVEKRRSESIIAMSTVRLWYFYLGLSDQLEMRSTLKRAYESLQGEKSFQEKRELNN